VDDRCVLLESTGWAHLLDGRDIRNDHSADVKETRDEYMASSDEQIQSFGPDTRFRTLICTFSSRPLPVALHSRFLFLSNYYYKTVRALKSNTPKFPIYFFLFYKKRGRQKVLSLFPLSKPEPIFCYLLRLWIFFRSHFSALTSFEMSEPSNSDKRLDLL
jgi:hypothetical protein